MRFPALFRVASVSCALLAGAFSLRSAATAAGSSAPGRHDAPTAATKAAAKAISLPEGLRTLDGTVFDAARMGASKATVFVFASTECPISRLYAPRMTQIAQEYGQKGVSVVTVFPAPGDTDAVIRRYLKDARLPLPAVRDAHARLADALQAHTTPEVIVLDSSQQICYRGRIDDNRDSSKVIRHDLSDALDALLANKPIARPRTLAFGCAIFREPAAATASAVTKKASVTWARDVAPILYSNCVSCHRTGETAPFALETYPQAKTWASAIRDYTANRLMPPWKAAPNFGEFTDAHTLTTTQIATLKTWADSGAPAGEVKTAPRLPSFPPPGQWGLGKPDLILHSSRPYHLAADGPTDLYREFVLPIDLPDDVYLSAIAFRPDKRAVVHHMIAYLDPRGRSVELDGKESEPGYTVPGTGIGVNSTFLQGWAPGNTPRFLPAGTAIKLPKGAKLVLQVHYNKNGRTEADQSAIGLYFAHGPIDRVMHVNAVANLGFDLKPGMADQKVTGDLIVPADVEVYSASPHMHMLGRSMTVTATKPSGEVVPMIKIDDWDFNWQNTYAYKNSFVLPAGTRVHLEAMYDNSENNPRQPSQPPREVRWGENTTDEMCIGFFSHTILAQHLGLAEPKGRPVLLDPAGATDTAVNQVASRTSR